MKRLRRQCSLNSQQTLRPRHTSSVFSVSSVSALLRFHHTHFLFGLCALFFYSLFSLLFYLKGLDPKTKPFILLTCISLLLFSPPFLNSFILELILNSYTLLSLYFITYNHILSLYMG